MYRDVVVSLKTARGSDIRDTQYKTCMLSAIMKARAFKLDVLFFFYTM